MIEIENTFQYINFFLIEINKKMSFFVPLKYEYEYIYDNMKYLFD